MYDNVTVAVRDARTGALRHDEQTSNTICVGWHELLVRLADPEDSLNASDDVDYELALGIDGATGTDYTHRGLNTEVARTNVTDYVNEGTSLYTSTFVDSSEANGHTITETGVVAVVGGETYLCNHAQVGAFDKTSQKTATIDHDLQLLNDTNDS